MRKSNMIADKMKGRPLAAEEWLDGARHLGLRLTAVIRDLRRAAKERAQLRAFSERELHDIGLTRVDALRVAERPLWRWRSAWTSDRRWIGGGPLPPRRSRRFGAPPAPSPTPLPPPPKTLPHASPTS